MARKRRSRSRLDWGQALGWFLGGIGLGLAVVTPLLWLGGEEETGQRQVRKEVPDAARPGPPPRISAEDLPRKKRVGRREPPSAKPDAAGKAEGAQPEGEDYRFYTLLPEMETDVPPASGPDQEKAPSVPADRPTLPRRSEAGDFLIQVASFKARSEAEALKARLALRGLQARIREKDLETEGTWYRVQLGPYAERPEAEAVSDRLEKAGLKTLVVRK
jgi:cell division protein FtsN